MSTRCFERLGQQISDLAAHFIGQIQWKDPTTDVWQTEMEHILCGQCTLL
jgi:hypothetical protein